MSRSMPALPIFYRLREDIEVRESGDVIVVVSPCRQVTITGLSPLLRQMLLRLAHTACSTSWINATLQQAPDAGKATTFYRYLSCLLRQRMAMICAGDEGEGGVLATLLPISPGFRHVWTPVQMEREYRLSRFACIRRDDNGSLCLESPLSHACLRLEQARAAGIVYLLGNPVTLAELTGTVPAEERENVTGMLALLLMGNFVSPTTPEGQATGESDEAAMHWEFHDLLFHSRSRVGRHENDVGGTYRFLSRFAPRPAVKQATWPASIALFRPDVERLRQDDPTLTAVLEERTSLREYGARPMTLLQLGEFLYRVARVKAVSACAELGEYTERPYPGAGASYELELYLTVERCEGLAPGLYWYNPAEHALALVHAASQATRQLLLDASQAMGGCSCPQILITLAARFQRVSWKYQGLAYSLILKDVGVLYATMYLVATAMKLAPCALGAGDSDLFARLSGTDYLAETSVGEFMLGSRPTCGA